MADTPTVDWALEEAKDKELINQFSMLAQGKMTKNREKGRYGWHDKELCSADYLSDLLIKHVFKGDPMDVALIAMMLVARNERIHLNGV